MEQANMGHIPMEMKRPDYELYHYKTAFEPVELHFHDFYEVFILLSSAAVYQIDGHQYTLTPGSILLISPQELHRPLSASPAGELYERVDIYIRPEYIAMRSNHRNNLLACFQRSISCYGGNLLQAGEHTRQRIMDVIDNLRNQVNDKEFGYQLLEEAYLTELLVLLNRASLESLQNQEVEESGEYSETMEKIVRYINENLTSDVSLNQLADRFFMSKYHLVRMFKRNTGFTPHQFIRYKRLLTARMLLRGGKSVTDVCHECGFTDYSNFIRAFREEFGMSPRKYATTEMRSEARKPLMLTSV